MITPDLSLELELWQQGYTTIAGLDEAGRGAWAGPVVAAAVVLPVQQLTSASVSLPPLLRDSKLLSPAQREQVATQIIALATAWAVGQAEAEEIDRLGIAAATFLAMERALAQLPVKPSYHLIDGFAHPTLPAAQQRPVVKGDARVASIAAASVLAKVYRDRLLIDLARAYAHYDLDQHKGYGTKAHREAIRRRGLSPIHRTSFRIKDIVDGAPD